MLDAERVCGVRTLTTYMPICCDGMGPDLPIALGNEELVRFAAERLGVSDPRLDMGVMTESLVRNVALSPSERLDAFEAAHRAIAELARRGALERPE